MTRAGNNSSIPSDDILSVLSPQRRQAITEEALGTQLHNLIAGAKDFGELVEALTRSPYWSVLKHFPISALIRLPSAGATAATRTTTPTGAARAHVPTPVRAPEHKPAPAHTPIHAPAQTPAHAPANTKAHAPAQTPIHAPAQTPAHDAPAQTPAHDASAQTPAHDAPAQSPAHHAPAQAPAHESAHAPAAPSVSAATPQTAPRPVAPAAAKKAVDTSQLLAIIAASPGIRIGDILDKAEGDREKLKTALAMLRADGKVKAFGAKRGMSYTLA